MLNGSYLNEIANTGVDSSFLKALSEAYNNFSEQIMLELTLFSYDPRRYGFADLDLVSKEYAIQKYFEPRVETYVRQYLVAEFFEKVLMSKGYDVYLPTYNGPEDQYIDGEYFCSNKEFEDHTGFSFVIADGSDLIGCRLTDILFFDANNYFKSGIVTKIIILDWYCVSGISDDEKKRRTYGIEGNIDILGIREFVSAWLGPSESIAYELFMRNTIQDYQETIGISSLPKLTAPVLFEHRLEEERIVLKSKIKDILMFAKIEEHNCELPEEQRINTHFGYRIIDYSNFKTPSEIRHAKNVEEASKDLLSKSGILETFSNRKLYKALIGKGDFAKSFLTSEYLYSQYNENDLFDYTAIVSGYLKSVEQLLRTITFLHIDSETDGIKRRIKSNGKRNRTGKYPDSSRKEGNVFKIDFISENAECVDTTIGSLIHFAEDYSQNILTVNDQYKSVIIDCLECYRIECRNDSFHQHNNYDWTRVEAIRHNTILLYIILLGGFQLVSEEKLLTEKFEIVSDDRLERIYYWLRKMQMYTFRVKLPNEEGYYLATRFAENTFPRFDDNGFLLEDFEITTRCTKENSSDEKDKIFVISRNSLPEEIWYKTYVETYPIDFSL